MNKVGRAPRPIKVNGVLCTVEDAARLWKLALIQSIDCHYLANNEFDNRIPAWVLDPSTRQSKYIKALHMQAKVLKMPSCQAHRDRSRKMCQVDCAIYLLTHISQECITWQKGCKAQQSFEEADCIAL